MSACACGCSVRGEHLGGCDGTAPGRDGGVVECRGCLPRRAEHGVLCARCWGRLQSAVRTLPSLIEHLRAVAAPAVSSPAGRTGSGRARRPGGGMLYPAALVEADELHAVLAAWCEEVAAERPGASAPPRRATRWTASAAGDREPLGPAGPGSTRVLARWLDAHLEWAAGRPWAGDMLTDLAGGARAQLRRIREEVPVRRAEGVRCTRCHSLSVVVVPPAAGGGRALVRCTLPACGAVLGEDDWACARARALAATRGGRPENGGGA